MHLNICIFGISGYTGSKLIEIISKHKNVKICAVFGSSTKGKKIKELFPKIKNLPDIVVSDYKSFNFDDVDVVFSCLPHGIFQNEIVSFISDKVSIIDLSGDFRLDNLLDYEEYYSVEHKAKNISKDFVYGLSEINKIKISNSKRIANPGCYPTSILIPLIPLIKSKILTNSHIIIDSKSGISGAGKRPKIKNLHSEINENFFSYGIDFHRHYPEIKQEINKYDKAISFSFIPHILPVFTGIQSTIYINKDDFNEKDCINSLRNFYKSDFFVKLYLDDTIPKLSDVRDTNNIAIKVFEDFSQKKIVIISCIDNLVKGAAGQAIQNMNLMFGFNETESLV